MRYDVFYFDGAGRRQRFFDSDVPAPAEFNPQKGLYQKWVNTDWDRHVIRVDPKGQEISEFPWEKEQRP